MPLKHYFILSLFLISCGKAPPMPSYGKKYEPLINKSQAEIFEMKYDNKIDLKCSVHLGNKIVDSFAWNIMGEQSRFRFLNYQLDEMSMVTVIKLDQKAEVLDSYTHIDQNKNEYYLENSPVLKISFLRGLTEVLQNGSIHDERKFQDEGVFENLDTVLFSIQNEEEVRCRLVTFIPFPYRSQWQKIK